MSETGRVLKPANENPWYVLMTLYGEQDGEVVDEVLHQRNRAAWNAWACQGMSEEERSLITSTSKIEFTQIQQWDDCKEGITKRYYAEIEKRNGSAFSHPEFPNYSNVVDLGGVEFDKKLICSQYVFSSPVIFDEAFF